MAPSSDDTLRRILLHEKAQGHQNRAVLGGLARYLASWQARADDGANPHNAALIDAVLQLFENYALRPPAERAQVVSRALQLLAPQGDTADDAGAATFAEPTAPRRKAQPARERAQGPLTGRTSTGTKAGPSASRARDRRPREGTGAPLPSPASVSVTRLRGVGSRTAERLAVLGIRTLRDLVYHFPRRYKDYSHVVPVSALNYGELATIEGQVRSTNLRRLRGRAIFSATVADASGAIGCQWFNQPYLERAIREGMTITISGQVSEFRGRLVFTAPDWEATGPDSLHTGRIVPVYPLTEGVSVKVLRRLIHDALPQVLPTIVDPLPPSVRDQRHLQGLGEALQQIHFPDSMEQARQARDRLAFDELLLLQLGVLRKRQDWRSEPGIPIASEPGLVHDLEAHLPYTLTGAQQRAISEILQDMTRSVPMSRLLQGDVGSGKTIVALAAILTAVRAGFQAALMAPTSILAEQHMRTISGILEYYPKVRMGLLLGGQTALEKEAMRRALAEGEIDLVVGTHALIQDEVSFKRLGLVVVDEQHRFGVEQRQTLRAKSIAWSPHLLAMSATPIPRTLALTLYGDMELSVLDELPPNRQPVVTAVRTASSREGIYRFIRDQISAGHQAYIIYPLVEESEAVEARAAVEEHDRLAQEVFPQLRLGLLHGRIGAEEKERVMSQFREGQLDILVSTAVVEVGMDVPNATVMLIEGAERFGLAQLHQFRGRVGRGSSRSYCILVSDSTTEESLQRLQIMAETEDGFVLAEKDLEMRGPGDFIGVRQSGLPELRLAQVTDRVTLEQARAEALQIFAQDPDLSESRHRALAEHAEAFWRPVSPA